MKNRAKKVIAVGLAVCLSVLLFVFSFFATKPYTEKIIIWLPNNYKLENSVLGEVVSIMPTSIDNPHQSNEPFYSRIAMVSFKKLAGKNEKVSVRIEDASYSNHERYRIVYQRELDCGDKIFFVAAQKYYEYNKRILSEMKLRGDTLFLKNKRNTRVMYAFLGMGFGVIAYVVFFIHTCFKNIRHKKQSNI